MVIAVDKRLEALNNDLRFIRERILTKTDLQDFRALMHRYRKIQVLVTLGTVVAVGLVVFLIERFSGA